MTRLVCFNHGKESGPWGTKIRRLADVARERGYQVISPDYQGMASPEQRIEKLSALLPADCAQLVLVGSSMGAYVAAAVSAHEAPEGLFLLAPAVYLPGYPTESLVPRAGQSLVIHGWGDELVPADNVIRWCREQRLPLLLLDGDHRLMTVLDTLCERFGHFLDGLSD